MIVVRWIQINDTRALDTDGVVCLFILTLRKEIKQLPWKCGQGASQQAALYLQQERQNMCKEIHCDNRVCFKCVNMEPKNRGFCLIDI